MDSAWLKIFQTIFQGSVDGGVGAKIMSHLFLQMTATYDLFPIQKVHSQLVYLIQHTSQYGTLYNGLVGQSAFEFLLMLIDGVDKGSFLYFVYFRKVHDRWYI